MTNFRNLQKSWQSWLYCLVTLLFLMIAPQARADYSPRNTLYGPFEVVRILDGDSFLINLDGKQEIVHLISIDAPNTPEAALYLGRLISGKSLFLELDNFERDFNGDILAYAYVYNPIGAWVWQGQRWSQINQTLLESGLAELVTTDINFGYENIYLNIPKNVHFAEAAGQVVSPNPPVGMFVDLERNVINHSMLHRPGLSRINRRP